MPATIIYETNAPVKRSRPFARGVFTERPFTPAPADRRWLAENDIASREAEELALSREADLLWLEARAVERMSAGLEPW